MGADYESNVLQSAVSATPTEAPVAPIDNTFGAILIGNFVGLLMYGIILYQAYDYFRLYSKDTRRLKCLVFALLYFYLVTNYFNPAALLIGTWSAVLMGVVMSIIIFVAQVFYVRRIYLLSRSYRGLVVVMSLLLVGELGACNPFRQISHDLSRAHTIFAPEGAATFAAIEGSTRYQFMSQAALTRIESTALVAVLVVDLFLASTLVVIFHRNRTGYKRTDSLLNILVIYTVNTCVLTSAINALALSFLIAFPTNMIYFGILTPATRSYTMAVLGVLNSRKALLEEYNRTGKSGAGGHKTDEESGNASQTRVKELSTEKGIKHSVTFVGEDTLIGQESTKGCL
ncbi:hypothetical protein GSI_15113 [Ganoderma sinense ZZ0214-1]|uniref:DUF6534 domain-containing protein n=1 Tax=Ganoderma sinense ZZ0214-1 TaxID=1077348 RepID=A0A2G8RLN0_9APHY|nr:hypothetical protein GSI_15113 [Ganoderma sinense ZZ0214-1]